MFKEEEKVKKAKKRERKQVEAKPDAQVPWRRKQARKLSQEARREKQKARKVKQRARQRRKRARQARKKEEMQLRPEKPAQAKHGGHQGKLVDQEVKKILMRAPLNMMSDSPKSNCEGKAGKLNVSNPGWKAGMRAIASETAPARQGKKLPTSQFLKLLKKVMRLAANEVGSNVRDTDLESPEVEERASPSPARQETVLPPDNSDQKELTSPEEHLKSSKQEQLHIETPEDRGPNDHGVVLEDIGPDLCTDTPEMSQRAGVTSRYIVGLNPDNNDGKEQADTPPSEKIHQEQQAASVVLEPDQEERVVPGENSNFKEQDSPHKVSDQKILLQLPSEAEKSKLRRRRRRREHAERRTGGDSSSEDEEESERKGKPKLFKGLDKSMPSLTDSDEDEVETERSGKAKVIGELTESSDEEPINGTEPNIYIGDFRGGGAGGSNYYVWLQMAQRIMVGVRRAQLPLTLPLNDITEGDGNCYFRAVLSQCQRPEHSCKKCF